MSWQQRLVEWYVEHVVPPGHPFAGRLLLLTAVLIGPVVLLLVLWMGWQWLTNPASRPRERK